MGLIRKGQDDVHLSAIAGTWYPSDVETLRAEIDGHLSRVQEPAHVSRLPAALITPHAGYRWSGDCAAHLYRPLRGDARVRRVIILAPSHYAHIGGASVLPVRAYRTPLGDVPVDRNAAADLLAKPGFTTVPAAHTEEHSDEIQLPFLQAVLPGGWTLLDVVLQGTGPADWPAVAEALAPWVDDSTVLIASSDFTHYGARFGYVPFREDVPENLRALDLGAVDAALSMDPSEWTAYREKTGITACGYEPIGTLLTLLNRLQEARPGLEGGFAGKLLDYYRSGDLNGDYESSVSYAAVLFQVSQEPQGREALDRDEQVFLLAVARRAIEGAVRGDPIPAPDIPRHLPRHRLERKRAVFVTLRAGRSLRGCIGSIFPREPLVRAVMRHAIQAALEDNRFPPVGRDEMDDIQIEISVLTVPTEIADPGEIVLGRDGILLERDGRRAVFLPQVASENAWDLETTLRHLAAKAGLASEAWKGPDATLRTFRAQIFAE